MANSGMAPVNLRTRLLKVYLKMQNWTVPNLRSSQEFYEKSLDKLVEREMCWLDLGCGHQLLPSWRKEQEKSLINKCSRIVGIDFDLPSLRAHQNINLRVQGDVTKLPFANASFDLVTANMVVEHLEFPRAQFHEINRVLKPGGIFVFHTPNALSHFALMRKMTPAIIKNGLVRLLDGREPEDVFEVQYQANTPKVITALARDTGFEDAEIKMVSTAAVFEVIPPLAFIELLWIKVLMTERFKRFRTNIIAILRKDTISTT